MSESIVVKCKGTSQKGEPCSWKPLSGQRFCKRHSEYEKYTDDEYPKLKRCSDCKKHLESDMFDGDKATCTKCNDRSKKTNAIRKETKDTCQGFTGSNKSKPCTNERLGKDYDGDLVQINGVDYLNPNYCGKHQKQGWVIEKKAEGKKICSNWIRGCFSYVKMENSKCDNCRKNANDKANEKKDERNKEINEINEDLFKESKKKCKDCGKIKDIEFFQNLKGEESVKCSQCLEKDREKDGTRNSKDKSKPDIRDMRRTQNRGIRNDLSDDDIIDIKRENCFYCGKCATITDHNTVDRVKSRLDSGTKAPYQLGNVVPCCAMCNEMKLDLNVNVFYQICEHIATYHGLYDGELNYDNFTVKSSNYNTYKNNAKQKAKKQGERKYFNLTKEEFDELSKENCFYCGIEKEVGGIDRVNSLVGYYYDNCVSACYTCNKMKSKFDINEFVLKCYQITHYNHSDKSDHDLYNQIEELKKEIYNYFVEEKEPEEKRFNERFLQDDKYYKDMIFNGNLEVLKKVKIELEIVKDKQQKDIWNYYRCKVSSLKKDTLNIIGRSIRILVKDKTTDKYLGIISLSSDLLDIAKRDEFIGWSYGQKLAFKYINHLMNITTCVPLTPFGFNFCGGKLLASLAFSKEVSEYFYEKYKQPLLGITTFSLYGKSVQYDRLPYLKFRGYSKGYSTIDIPQDIYKKSKELMKLLGIKFDSRKKLYLMAKVLHVIGLSKDEYLTTDQKKGIYFGFVHKDSKECLTSNKEFDINNINNLQSADDIFKWWLNRWAINRYNNVVKDGRFTNKIELYDIKRCDSYERVKKYVDKMREMYGSEEYKNIVSKKKKLYYKNRKNDKDFMDKRRESNKKSELKKKSEIGDEEFKELNKNRKSKHDNKKKQLIIDIIEENMGEDEEVIKQILELNNISKGLDYISRKKSKIINGKEFNKRERLAIEYIEKNKNKSVDELYEILKKNRISKKFIENQICEKKVLRTIEI